MKDKVLWKFLLVLVICAIGGGVVGYFMAGTENSISGMGDILTHLIIRLTPIIIPGAGGLFTILFFICYLSASRNYKVMDEEDEAVFDAIEHKLSLSVAMTSIGTILLFIFMGIMATNSDDYNNHIFLLMMEVLIFFILFF